MKLTERKYVPDTSAVIEKVVSKLIKEGRVSGKLLIHRAVVSELEMQANRGREVGFIGLDELKKVQQLAEESDGAVSVEVFGERPTESQIRLAKTGEIDALIRDDAWRVGATLITCDRVQAETALAMGIDTIYIKPRRRRKGLFLDKFFDSNTMSVHLKEGTIPYAKKGVPGRWKMAPLSNRVLTKADMERYVRQIISAAKTGGNGFVESERRWSTIVQLGEYRVVVVKPPLSDGLEITVARPLTHLELEDYKLHPKLIKRLETQAEGILIAGAPGMGKTTFAEALARFYKRKGKTVKTVESPRDLHLPDDVTQYSKSHAVSGEIHDILLLSRPDYTVFDEMRTSEDFALFADMRLAGVGMIGVVHATTPIDAIQRMIGRIELGVIPSIIDTVIFIENGEVSKVYELTRTVKVPTGMTERDLARPVVEVRDFITGELEYEIYTFGEQTHVIPVRGWEQSANEFAEKVSEAVPGAKVEVLGKRAKVYIPKEMATRGVFRRLRRLGRAHGVRIDIATSEGEEVTLPYELRDEGDAVIIDLGKGFAGARVALYGGGRKLTSAKADQSGKIRLSKKRGAGKKVLRLVDMGENIEVRLRS